LNESNFIAFNIFKLFNANKVTFIHIVKAASKSWTFITKSWRI